MPPRFFATDRSPTVTLAGPEAHHLLHVLRMAEGDEVELFDGAGFASKGRVAKAGRSTAEVAAGDWRLRAECEPAGTLRVVSALPKGKRLDFLLEKATELGMTHFAPLLSRYTVRSARRKGEGEEPAALGEPARRTCIEAARQCRRNRLPEFGPPIDVSALAARPPAGARLIARPGAPPATEWARTAAPAAEITVVIGPEGGLDDEEDALLSSGGWVPVGLGPAVMRIETAVLAALAQLVPLLRPPTDD